MQQHPGPGADPEKGADREQAYEMAAKSNKRGKMTDRVQARIVRLVREGNFRKHAAEAAGVDERTVKEWMRLGQREDATEPHKSFAANVLRAEAEAITNGVQVIRRAMAKNDAKTTIWFLGRKAPAEWGDKARRELKDAIETVLEVIEDELGTEQAKRVGEAIARRLDARVDGATSGDEPSELH